MFAYDMIRHRTYDGIVIWLGVAKIWKQPFAYMFTPSTQKPSELCSPHTCPKASLGRQQLPRGGPQSHVAMQKNPSFHAESWLIARHNTSPHPQLKSWDFQNWVLVYNIINYNLSNGSARLTCLEIYPQKKRMPESTLQVSQFSHWITILYMERED